MSAYHHVKDRTPYPAVLLTVGMNDPRVDPWESANMTARLQSATSSGKPVLLRVDYDAGHSGLGARRRQRDLSTADMFAFLRESALEEALTAYALAMADQMLPRCSKNTMPPLPPEPASSGRWSNVPVTPVHEFYGPMLAPGQAPPSERADCTGLG